MKHALIREVLGSDQFIGIDGRFGYDRIVETIRDQIEKRKKVLPRFDCYTIDVYRGPRIGEGGIVMTLKVGSPISQHLALM